MLVILEALEDALNMERTSTPKSRWLLIVPAAIVVLIGNVGIHILYMVIYSYLINPGRDMAHYQAHAEFSAPYSSIVVGFPLMFLVCRWVGKKFAAESSVTAALLICLVYFLIDMTVVVLAGGFGGLVLILVISHATKFVAAYFGGLAARKQIVAGV
jgi:hypothetical protein